MNPIDLMGNIVLVGSVVLGIVGLIWLPILRRRELAQIDAQKSKPIFVELHGSTQFNPDGSARSEAISDLSADTRLTLKTKTLPDSEEIDAEVFTSDHHSLGVLPAAPGREIAKELAAGKQIEIKIDLLSGGSEQEPDYYMKLVLKRQRPQIGKR